MNKYESSLAISLVAGILATASTYIYTDAESMGIMNALIFWFVMIPTAANSLMLKRQYAKNSKEVKYWDSITSILFILATFVYSIIQYYPQFFNLLYPNFFNFQKAITPILIIVPMIQIVILLCSKKKQISTSVGI